MQVRLAGMKLLGSLLSTQENLFLSEAAALFQLRAALSLIAVRDPSKDAQHLAQQLLAAITPS
jgi:hypothetical protein